MHAAACLQWCMRAGVQLLTVGQAAYSGYMWAGSVAAYSG